MDETHFIHEGYKNKGQIKIENKSVINTINFMQSIPFMINKNLLLYLFKSINNKVVMGDELHFELHKDTNQFLEYQREGEMNKVLEILRWNSIFHLNISTISAALLLKNYEFYHPIFLD